MNRPLPRPAGNRAQGEVNHVSVPMRSRRAAATLLLAAASGFLLIGAHPGERPLPPWLVLLPAMHKAPASEALPASLPALALSAARGECEGAQLALTSGTRLLGARLGRAPAGIAAALYRLDFVPVREPSNGEGRPGRWPDPLIPERDRETGEPLPAFLRPARDGEPTLLYVELCAAPGAAAGRHGLALHLEVESAAGHRAQRLSLPLTLTVRRFALPATATLATSFGFSSLTAARAHGLADDDPAALAALTRRYAASALRHRVSLHGLSMAPPDLLSRSPLRLDFTRHDAELAPLLDGALLDSGARATSFDVRAHPGLRGDAAAERAYFQRYEAHLRARGWLDRAFFYVADEPGPAELPEVRRRAERVRAAAPGIRVLVTHGLDPQLAGAIDIWTPNLNCLFERPAGDAYCRASLGAAGYAVRRAMGERLWWYQSCGSHGCAAQGELSRAARAYFEGWPSYMIDHGAALNRAMGALASAHGIEGELYFNTVEAWNPGPEGQPPDPWRDLLRFHGNGDGTLFYPGTPERLGVALHRPVESLRLKHLRDGLEDFEYLALARALGQGDAARRFTEAVAPRPWSIARDPAAWQKAREALAQAIEAALAQPKDKAETEIETKAKTRVSAPPSP